MVNGYVYTPQDYSRRVLQQQTIQQSSQSFLMQFNVMLGAQLLIVMFGLILYFVENCRQPDHEDDPPRLPRRLSTFLLEEVLYLWVLLTSMGYAYAVGTYFRNINVQPSTFLEYIANFVCIAIGAVITGYACYNAYKSKPSSRIKEGLREGSAGSPLASYHPLILILYRLFFGLILGLTNGLSYRGFVAIVIQLSYLLFNIIRNPFKHNSMMARQLTC